MTLQTRDPGYFPVAPPGENELPYEDDENMESERHKLQMNLLIESLSLEWRDRTDFYVGGNMFIYFSELQTKKNDFRGPDVFVVLDTIRREHKSWVVWEENGRTPDVVIELLSPKTESVDRGQKMTIYARQLHVPEYYLFDPDTKVFEGYALNPVKHVYERMNALRGGDLPSQQLGLTLGVRPTLYQGLDGEWLRWLSKDGVRILPTNEEDARIEKERARSYQEEARLEKERARSYQEEVRLEKERADELAAKLAEYEERFGSIK